MRYVLNTKDEQGLIGIQIAKWQEEGKLDVIEKTETLVEIEQRLEKISIALNALKKAGYNSSVMWAWIKHKTKLRDSDIRDVLNEQENFYRQIGLLK